MLNSYFRKRYFKMALHYKTPDRTVGKVADIPQIDPIILEFSDQIRDAYFKKDLKLTTKDLTPHINAKVITQRKKNNRTRKNEIHAITITKMLKVLHLVRDANGPITMPVINELLGFSCIGILTRAYSDRNRRLISLEELGLVECEKRSSHRHYYRITEKGLKGGEDEIKKQLPGYTE